MARAGSYGKVGMGPKKKKAKSSKAMTFGQAFAKNRKAGKATFTYKGKKYSTKTKSEVTKKATRTQGRALRKKGRAAAKTKTTMRGRMAARRAGRKAARSNRRLNKGLRR